MEKKSGVNDDIGVGSHNNDDPPSDFANHVVVEFYVGAVNPVGQDWLVFDPSYGLGHYSRELFEYGPNARIVGLSIWDDATETKFVMKKNTGIGSLSQLNFVIGQTW